MSLHLESRLLASHGFCHGFSLRAGGVSRSPFDSLNLGRAVGDDPEHVAQNHRLLAASIGYAEARLYETSQVHGVEVREVTSSSDPGVLRAVEADALVSRVRGCALGVRVADCVAVLLACPRTGAVAAVHAGWRGTAGRIVEHAVTRLCALSGTPASALVAALFPHIGVEAFEVGPEVAAQIENSAPGAEAVVAKGRDRPHVDLSAALVWQLRAAGVGAASTERVAGCTFREPDRFFSFRRDGSASGRHLAVIVPRC